MNLFRTRRKQLQQLEQLPELPLPPNRWRLSKRNGAWEVRRRCWYYEYHKAHYPGVDTRWYRDRLFFVAPTLDAALRWIDRQPKEIR